MKAVRFVSCLIALVTVPAFGEPPAPGAKPAPVRMGCGIMTFDTVPGWGLDDKGLSQIGPTHGGVAVDSRGNIFTSADAGLFVFSPDGKVVRRHLGGDYTRLHDIEIRKEADGEYLYGARNANAEGIKINVETGGTISSSSTRRTA